MRRIISERLHLLRDFKMTSLKQKYFILNTFCGFVNVGVIALLFYVCNNGFKDLTEISAKNLSTLYAMGELKTLLSKEMLALSDFSRSKIPYEVFLESARKASMAAKKLESDLPFDLRDSIVKFQKSHDSLLRQIASSSTAKPSLRSQKDRGLFDFASELYSQGYVILNAFDEALLLDSIEQQGDSIRSTNRMMKVTLWGAIGFTISVLLSAFFYFKKRIINPILKVSAVSLRAAKGSYEPFYLSGPEDEIGILAKNFNHMMGEISRNSDVIRAERDNAERANQAKSIFLANMSHELRTPMHGILSFAKFGQQKLGTISQDRIKSYFDEIYDSGSRLMTLLNDLLDLSKLESGSDVCKIKQNDLVQAIRSVTTEVEAFAEEKGLRIHFESETPEVVASFDDFKIMQVVRNLLSNAIKFSNVGTVIRIEVSKIGGGYRCQIANTGLGIPEAELQSVFDKFVQSSKTRTGAGGTGLGLAISKEIVQMHGGRIWAESNQGGETRFIFEIPLLPNPGTNVS